MGILKNTFTVGAFTMLSRVLGLVREMFQSRLIGAGMEQSAFALAFAIPNMFRKLFGEGALTAAFVPVFAGELAQNGVERASRLARAVLTMAVLMLCSIVVLSMSALCVFSPFAGSERSRLAVSLVGMLLPYMVFICAAAFGMGVLNAMGRFKASSFMPALLNAVWILALAFLSFFPGFPVALRVKLVAAAILFAGALQMVVMFACMRRAGVSPKPSFSGWGDGKVKLVWRNMAIAALGSGAIQVNYMLDAVLAQLASDWAAGVIGYAERLMDLPLGVVGVAFGTVLLPTFSGLFARGDVAAARETLLSSVKSLLFVMIPAAAGLFVLAPAVVKVIYEGGDFDALATVRVARALGVYAVGLGFFGFQKTLVPWFQAQNDMKTPLRVSVATVGVNASLNILAIWLLPVEWRHVGLAASTVFCAALGCTILAVCARRGSGSLGLRKLVVPVGKILLASVAMGAALAWLSRRLSGTGAVLSLAILVVSGVAVYGLCALAAMPDLVAGLRNFARRRRI